MKISVIGSGGWGTAASILLHNNGHDVTLWSFFQEEAALLDTMRVNEKFLPGIKIPGGITITNDLEAACASKTIVLATPSFAAAKTAERLSHYLKKGHIFVCLTKGFDRDNGYCIFSETFEKIFDPSIPIVCVTGPSHAEEVGRGVPTVVVAASKSYEAAMKTQDIFMSDCFRVYTTPDIVGAELGGGLKNIIALAAGISDGMGFGDNTKAALMTRGLTEMARLGISRGGLSETFAGLSGLGDLIVTCTSMHSRNRRAGILIGSGKTPKQAIDEVGSVVEGYFAAEAAHTLAKEAKIEMPISETIYKILYKGLDPQNGMTALMGRTKRHEIEEIWMKDIKW